MPISRRLLLSWAVSGLAAPALLTRPALAEECTAPADLSKGISFTRKDGSRGLARREGDGSVVIDYITNKGEMTDRRRVVNGVFETWRLYNDSEFPVVGSAPPEYTWKYAPKPVTPEAGGSWSGTVSELRDEVGYGEYMKENHSKSRTKWKASYQFLASDEVKLSGCYYMIVPVEAVFQNGTDSRSQRWLYFPQLGVGIETKRDGVGNGLTRFARA